MKYIVLVFLICYLSGCYSAQIGEIGKLECKPNEVLEPCPPCHCPEATCQIPKPKCSTDIVCLHACFPSCECAKGFLRDESTGICVTEKNCK
uniref:Venom serine protease inhibitor-like isoform X1 n=1 Tax=Diabrotica virgifera virgifera TaxID=50390 RepID=A0A6P7GHE3_DIAVI